MSDSRISSAHVLAAIAIFIALGGSALAVSAQSVKSKHVRDNTLRSRDVRNGALTGADLADASVTGRQIDEATLELNLPASPSGNPAGGPPTGPASGDLSGSYPAPEIAAAAVGSPELAPNGVTSQAVAPQTLSADDLASNSVTSSELAGSSVQSSELAGDSVFASEVADGTLNGDDVGRESGTIPFDPPFLFAGGIFSCILMGLDAGVPDDLRNDAIVVSSSITGVTLTPVEASGPGKLSVEVCNTTGFDSNPPAGELNWIAFDV